MQRAARTDLLCDARSQLILVDYQQRLLPAIAGGEAVLANALRLARLAQALGVPCTGTEQTPAKLGPLPPELRSLCAAVLAKSRFDACAEGLGHALRPAVAAGRTQLVVAGCEAHVCFLQTALGLLAEGHELWVVADACGSRAPANRELALDRLARAGAALVSTEMVGFEWVRDARHPQFRTLQSLVR